MNTADVVLNDGTLLCRAEVADNFKTRGIGLLGRKGLDADTGLLIVPCTSVHTMFMRFPIDVLFLDGEDRVVKVARMPAWRFALGGRGAKKVLELPYGAADAHNVEPGTQLVFRTPAPVTG